MAQRPLGVYVHVPFCASRCGYCDFVTYTSSELGGSHHQAAYADAAIAEARLAAATLGDSRPEVSTVFFGGGTPTLLPPEDLVRVLRGIEDAFGVAADLEVTVEANPDSVDPRSLALLRAGGFNRISFGMQSVRRHVLAVLERTHSPGRAQQAVREARAAGFDHVNLDLIYGTPGETDDDWDATIDAALEADPDHISAYALTVEPRTRLGAQVRHGKLPSPDDDVQARRYDHVDDRLVAAGYQWYEVSNWARGVEARCRHNLLYWHNDHWWGIGPGAHSHVGGTRWWNVRHPARHREMVHAGELPVEGSECCTAEQRALETALLGIRLAEGLVVPVDGVLDVDSQAVCDLIQQGLVDPEMWETSRRIALTRTGRLLTDSVIRRLFFDGPRGQPRATSGCVAMPLSP